MIRLGFDIVYLDVRNESRPLLQNGAIAESSKLGEVTVTSPKAAIENDRGDFLRTGRKPTQTFAMMDRVGQTEPRFDAKEIGIGCLRPGGDRIPWDRAGMLQFEDELLSRFAVAERGVGRL